MGVSAEHVRFSHHNRHRCCLGHRELPSGWTRGPRTCFSPVLRYLRVLQRAVEVVEMVGTLQKKNMGIKLPSRKILFSPTQTAVLMLWANLACL